VRNKLAAVFAVALLVAFFAALMRIATLPLEAGDAYPPYSSLRADPRGTKALYESLAALNELHVERNFQPLPKLKGSEAAVLLLGEPFREAATWSVEELKFYESIVSQGGRLIIAFLPEPPQSSERRLSPRPDVAPAIGKRWHVAAKIYDASQGEIERSGSMPRETNAYLEPEDKSGWRVLERNDQDDATLIEHDFGKGQILLLTESYPLSNEGLRGSRPVSLIANLAGSQTRVVFDESHLGVANTGSVGTLIRRYRLTATFAVLLLLGLLFLWKNSTSLLPQHSEPRSMEAAAGADSQSGLVNLLKRSIPAQQLTRACWDRWKETRSLGRPVSDRRIALAEQMLSAASAPEGQVELYKKVRMTLTEKI
jgi:hypothetical protein